MLIPEMLIICIKNERGIECKKLDKRVLAIKHYYATATPEQRAEHKRKQSENKKKYWASLTKKEIEIQRKKNSKGVKKAYSKFSKKKLLELLKPAHIALRKIYDDPIKKQEHIKKYFNMSGIKKYVKGKSLIEKDIPRINDYSGVLSMSDLGDM